MNAVAEKFTASLFSEGDIGYMGDKSPKAAATAGSDREKLSPTAENALGYSGDKIQESIISPLPVNAPPFPKRLMTIAHDGKHYAQTGQWAYKNERGDPLFFVFRFDLGDGQKQFRPVTLWETDKGPAWRHKAPDAPRPLYGLDRLARHQQADVIVCEGEKATEAALGLFPEPEFVTIASMNGAASPDKTDWTPLAGRRVFIWPDADIAGAQYAAAVEHILSGMGCTLSRVKLDRLLSAHPGKIESFPAGWDAADALAEGYTAELIASLIDVGKGDLLNGRAEDGQADEIKPGAKAEHRPKKVSEIFTDPTGFAVIEGRKGFRNGVYWQDPSDDSEDPKAPLWLCAPLIILAETRDSSQSGWGRLLSWMDNDNHQHTWACPIEMLESSDTVEFRKELSRNGLVISSHSKARQKLTDYTKGYRPLSAERVRCVTKTGWHGARYVQTHRVFGKQEGESVIFQGETSADFTQQGGLDDWQREVSARAVGNSRIVFAISAAFAGPLTEMSNESGGGFQFTGETSKGKTSTLIDPAASVWGHPDKYARKWRTTTNGLESLCLARNHATLILDDLGQSDAKECGQAAYLIANGQGKARMQREGGNRPLSTWKTFILSSGEIDLAQHMAEAGKVAKGGQVARLPSIPADAGAGMYVIENLHDQQDGRHFADTMKAVTRQFYGTAGTAFLERLTEIAELEEVTASVKNAVNEIVQVFDMPSEAAPEVGRVAARFALVAYAGELATRYGITGWPKGTSIAAAARCFNDWMIDAGGTTGADEKALLSQVAAFLQAHGSSRFPPYDISEDELRRVQNRAGFSAHDGENLLYLVERGTFERELCKGFNSKTAAKILIKSGWLTPGKERAQQQRRIPALGGKAIWVNVVTDNAIGGE